jgi:hypothetical protein
VGKRAQTFRSAGNALTGVLTAVVTLALAAFGAFYPEAGWPDWLIAVMVLIAVAAYVAQIRPAVVLGETHLTLRNMLQTVHVPWPAVGEVLVRQILTVEVGERVLDCPAVGRSARQIARDDAMLPDHHTEDSYGLLIENLIRQRAANARERQGIEEASPEQAALADDVRRVRAWPEIVLLAAAVAGLVVAIVV